MVQVSIACSELDENRRGMVGPYPEIMCIMKTLALLKIFSTTSKLLIFSIIISPIEYVQTVNERALMFHVPCNVKKNFRTSIVMQVEGWIYSVGKPWKNNGSRYILEEGDEGINKCFENIIPQTKRGVFRSFWLEITLHLFFLVYLFIS